jgi:hypothetical protein
MKKVLLFIIALFAGFLTASAQSNIFLHEKLKKENTNIEYPKFPAIKKINPGQDWWEPDTLYTFAKEERFNVLIIDRNIIEYGYYLQGLPAVKTKLFQTMQNNLWENEMLYSNFYDFNNNMITSLQQIWQNNSWVNHYLYTYTYDSNNNMITSLCQIWQNNSWVNHYLYTYTYDSNYNMITSLQQIWQNGLWINTLQETYTYDSNNNLHTYLKEERGRIIVETNTYDSNNNLLSSLRKFRFEQDNLWTNMGQETYTYDSNNNMLTYLKQFWQNDSLEDYYLTIYTYDSNNNLLTELFQKSENSTWENAVLDSYTYDSNNNMLTHLSQSWQNNSWETFDLYTYTYDSNNNMTKELWQKSSSLVNYREYRVIYDDNNNGISADFYLWINENWQPLSYDALSSNIMRRNIYYNNMQSAFEVARCYNVTASYRIVSVIIDGKEEIKTAPPIQIYSSEKTIHINNQTGKNGVVNVYRIDGVEVVEQTMTSHTTTLEIPVSGFYLVLVRAGNEKPVMAKVIVR